jgi:hypothetical protein
MNLRLAHSRRAGVAAVAALSLCAVGVTTALAVDEVSDPRAIVVNPDANFVELDGYPANTDVQVEVKRDGFTIGSTLQTTDGSGLVEINHAGGADCWQGASTPDIRGGDEIFVTVDGDPADTDSASVRDIQLDTADADVAAGTVTFTGHATSHPAAPLNTGAVSTLLRIDDLGVKAERAVTSDGDFTIVYDEDDADVGSDAVASWAASPDRAELTWTGAGITILSDVGGDPPVAAGCPPLALNDITTRSHPAVNAANVNQDMTVGGVSAPGVTSVQLTIDGADVGAAATPAGGTWQATIPAAALQGLVDGEFELGATFDGADPASETVLKDTVIPGQPTATPPAGTYTSSQFVSLNAAADVVQVRWTNGAGDPTQVYDGSAIPVSASQTLRALAVDAGGNTSGVASFAYVIQPPAGGGDDTGTPPAQNPGTQEPRVGGGTVITDPLQAFRVRSLRAPGRMSLRTARRRGVTARFLAPEGTQFVRASLFLHTTSSARGRRLLKRLTFAVDGSGRYAARFTDRRTRRKLRRGVYTLSIAPGIDATTFAEGTAKRFRIR